MARDCASRTATEATPRKIPSPPSRSVGDVWLACRAPRSRLRTTRKRLLQFNQTAQAHTKLTQNDATTTTNKSVPTKTSYNVAETLPPSGQTRPDGSSCKHLLACQSESPRSTRSQPGVADAALNPRQHSGFSFTLIIVNYASQRFGGLLQAATRPHDSDHSDDPPHPDPKAARVLVQRPSGAAQPCARFAYSLRMVGTNVAPSLRQKWALRYVMAATMRLPREPVWSTLSRPSPQKGKACPRGHGRQACLAPGARPGADRMNMRMIIKIARGSLAGNQDSLRNLFPAPRPSPCALDLTQSLPHKLS